MGVYLCNTNIGNFYVKEEDGNLFVEDILISKKGGSDDGDTNDVHGGA